MQPLFEHRLELAGYRTRALELEGDGPPLLLLHGYADSADTWRLVLDRLARAERRAVALDMPGFGACDRLDDAEPILPQLDRFADAAVEEFAAEGGAVVCGNSLGGMRGDALGASGLNLGRRGPGGTGGAGHGALVHGRGARAPCCARCWPRRSRSPARCCGASWQRSTGGWCSTGPPM